MRARLRPYPQALVAIIGGSLSTVGAMFEDGWRRFIDRDVDPGSAALEIPTRIALQTQRLVAQLVAAVREQISGAAHPTQALMAAIQLGEQEALRARLQVTGAQRDELQQSIETLTYRVTRLDAELAARRSVDERREDAISPTGRLEKAAPGDGRSCPKSTPRRRAPRKRRLSPVS